MGNIKKILTTFEAARYCQVHPGTIKNWIRNESLKAFKTPGGHRRIYKSDLDNFLKDKNIPVSHEKSGQRRRALIIDRDYRVREAISKLLHNWNGSFEVSAVSNCFEGGEMLVAFKPELVFVDLMICGLKPAELCSHIKNSPHLENIKVICLADGNAQVENLEVDGLICKPVDVNHFRQELEKVLATQKSGN